MVERIRSHLGSPDDDPVETDDAGAPTGAGDSYRSKDRREEGVGAFEVNRGPIPV